MSLTLVLERLLQRLEKQPWWPGYEMVHQIGMLARRIALFVLVAGTTATAAVEAAEWPRPIGRNRARVIGRIIQTSVNRRRTMQ